MQRNLSPDLQIKRDLKEFKINRNHLILQGPFSAVYPAFDTREEKDVCVRVFKSDVPISTFDQHVARLELEQRLPEHRNKFSFLCQASDDSIRATVFDCKGFSIQENLGCFLARRKKENILFNPTEMYSAIMQMLPPLGLLHTSKMIHGRLCLENVFVLRNRYNQIQFRLGDFSDAGLHANENEMSFASDLFEVGTILAQMFASHHYVRYPSYAVLLNTLLGTQDLANLSGDLVNIIAEYTYTDLRALLASDIIRIPFSDLVPQLDLISKMIDENPNKRPTNAVEALGNELKRKIPDFKLESSIEDEEFISAGKLSDYIVERAKLGNREAQYQLAIILLQKEVKDRALDYLIKSAKQWHLRSQALLSRLLKEGEVTRPDHVMMCEAILSGDGRAATRGPAFAALSLWSVTAAAPALATPASTDGATVASSVASTTAPAITRVFNGR